MKSTIIIMAILLTCSLGYSQPVAKPIKWPPEVATKVAAAPPKEESYFRAGEWNIDLYGTGSLKNEQRDEKDIRFGAGGGVTYFLSRGLGVGLRAESESTAHSVFDLVSGRVTYRAPLTSSFAPYGFIQGGFRFEQDAWEAGAGGGAEFRINRNLATFGEAGLVVDLDGKGLMRGAVGVRLSF